MASAARIVEIQERGQRFFPRHDLIDVHGQSLILPATRELGSIDVRDVADGFILMAARLIGFLPLTRTITLNIVPKFPIQNLWAMLEIGSESYARVLAAIRHYEVTGTSSPILLLARSFCYYLRDAISAGFERSYYSRTVSGHYKPRIEFGATISRHLSRGNPIDTVSSVYEFGLDSSINRIIKAACLCFARIIPRAADWYEERRLIQIALDTFQRVHEREPRAHDLDLDRVVSLRLRSIYSGMLCVYQLLLTGGGIAFTLERGGKELPSFLFNLEDIFERFVRQTFVRALREQGISVLDGNKYPGRLFIDNKTYTTKSDIIFRRRKRGIICVADVKYKPIIKESDRYQIISHVTAAGAPFGLLFSPANEGESQKLELLGTLPTGSKFYHYRVNIQGDIGETQAQMVKDISALLLAAAASGSVPT